MNAGDIVDTQLFQDIHEHIASVNPYAAIVGKKVKGHVPAGYINIEKDRVTGIVEKPKKGEEPSDMINLVFHYFSQPREFIDILNSYTSKKDDIYEQALSQIMQSHTVTHIPYTGSWQKLKLPHYVLDMMDLFLQSITETHIASSARVSDLARINGPVFIDEQVVVHPGAVIQGPAYIGKNAVIGNNSLVRNALVEEKAVIGFCSEVARSYIGPECMLHHNFIGDSILERNVNPSWGTTTGNLRLDGNPIAVKMPDGSRIQTERTKLGAILAEGVFCGINCSLMPGITMGKDTRVKPGTVVYDSIA
jgi:bifunctional UDP-N-acetylglucosamine pyrophosphorylase/glucosamine-1-phosphate N-acetyltransferase